MKRLSELAPPKPPFVPAALTVQACPQCNFLADGCSAKAVTASLVAHLNAAHGQPPADAPRLMPVSKER